MQSSNVCVQSTTGGYRKQQQRFVHSTPQLHQSMLIKNVFTMLLQKKVFSESVISASFPSNNGEVECKQKVWCTFGCRLVAKLGLQKVERKWVSVCVVRTDTYFCIGMWGFLQINFVGGFAQDMRAYDKITKWFAILLSNYITEKLFIIPEVGHNHLEYN